MISEQQVGGIPVLLAPTTGPMHAGLAFRVGMADEPLARRGITHLIEHLALHSAGVADYHYNGATGVRFTYFHMQGSENDVVKFLNGVCASLRELPIGRLAVEKEILRTEAGGRGGGVAEPMAIWRYGARDYGVPGYPEWGLSGLTADDLQAWVARYFTAGNAVLWVAGDAVPDGLDLSLPAGPRQPLPAPSSALPVRPAYFTGDSSSVAWNATVPRTPAASVFASVLERTMMRALRQDAGLSYKVETDYEPAGDDTAVVSAFADATPEKSAAVLGGLIDVLASMRVGRTAPADLTTVVNQGVEGLRQAEEQGARLPGQAFNLLTGRPVQPVEDTVAELRAVTAAEVTAVAVAAWNDGLLMAPAGTRGDWAGFAQAPTHSEEPVTGTPYASLEDPGERLIAGPDGLSRTDGEHVVSVRFDACEVVLAWPDGARRLIGADAVVVGFEPTLYRGAGPVTALIDERVPAARRVVLPERTPDRIPQPRPVSQQRIRREVPTEVRVGQILRLVVSIPIAVVFAFLALVMAFDLISGSQEPGSSWVLLVAGLLGTGLAVFSSYRAIRRLAGY